MLSSLELTTLFFKDLKSFNATNFKTIERAELKHDDATVHKAFSSVVTRYFSEYPDVNLDLLRPFQLELQQYVKENKNKEVVPNDHGTITV